MQYEKVRVAFDAVMFTIANDTLKVFLIKREKEPFKGKYELIGGLLLPKETAESALQRKLNEYISETSIYFTQFYTFTKPERDPRERTVSIGYIALVNEKNAPTTKEWFGIEDLPALAFDHKEIISKAKEHLANNLNSEIIKHFLPQTFPLNKLQAIHEAITGNKCDNRNFRKKMIASGIVKETDEQEFNVSHRPAKLYKFA